MRGNSNSTLLESHADQPNALGLNEHWVDGVTAGLTISIQTHPGMAEREAS
jgi:hypothetical protein